MDNDVQFQRVDDQVSSRRKGQRVSNDLKFQILKALFIIKQSPKEICE
jgi:hypothetical protein